MKKNDEFKDVYEDVVIENYGANASIVCLFCTYDLNLTDK